MSIIRLTTTEAPCEGEGCERRATMIVGAAFFCDPCGAFALVLQAHKTMAELGPEDRERFDEMVEAWARGGGQE